MWIQNVSKYDIIGGNFKDPGSNSMLIQILDPGEEFPNPPSVFSEFHRFEFLDVEGSVYTNYEDEQPTGMSEFAITPHQAEELARLLLRARSRSMNVVVHCHAGIFRSGAVAEVGVMLGFDDSRAFRCPNRLVKHSMLRALDMKYNPKEPMTINGNPCQSNTSVTSVLRSKYIHDLTKNNS